MPKYIRTKDRIYEVIEENSNYYKCCYDNGRITLVAKFDNDVNGFSKALKQADTIEELCDEFVYEMGTEHTLVTIGYEQIRDNILTCELLDMSNLYGAIWTSKGLIYVAKMNNDGKLILI